jgi:glycolate oxidase
MGTERIVNDLKKIVGQDNVEDDELVVKLYSRDAVYIEGGALAVVFPTSTKHVSDLVKYAYKNDLKIYPQGATTEIVGSSTPHKDGIIISFSKMNSIKEFNIIDSYVVVEPGIRINDLNTFLAKEGYMFPIDPASMKAATIGGAINSGAGGMMGVKYGTMKDWVLELETVIPDANGTILRLGCKTMKCRSGYDLVRLIIGSEGTLAIVTEATLKITPLPENVVTIASFFPTLEDLVNAVVELKKRKINLFIAEFVDAQTVDVVSKVLNPKIKGIGNLLIVSVDTPLELANMLLDSLEKIMRSNNATSIFKAKSMLEAEEMGIFDIRRGYYPTSIRIASEESKDPTSRIIVYVEDISVPPSKLKQAVEELRALSVKYNISMTLGGHIGDGNIHPVVWFEENNIKAKERVLEFFKEIMRLAIRLGGTMSSEHGIGTTKKEGLLMELQSKESEYALDLMKRIKNIFDPKGILNPGKIW